jgi:hypothetical protein
MGGRSGAFVVGVRCAWILSDAEGTTRVLPHSTGGSSRGARINSTQRPTTVGFAQLRTPGLPDGCVVVDNRASRLFVAGVPPTEVSHSECSIRRVPIGCTPHKIAFLGEAGYAPASMRAARVPVYVLAVSGLSVWKTPAGGEETHGQLPLLKGNPHVYIPPPFEYGKADQMGEPPIMEPEFELRLVGGDSWTTLERRALREPEDTGKEGVQEHVLSLQIMWFRCSEDESAPVEPFVAVSTGYAKSNNEEMPGRGRFILYQIKHVNSETDKDRVVPRLRRFWSKEEKAAVAAAAQVRRFVVLSAGSKVFVYEWAPKFNSFVMCGFNDMHLYTPCIRVLRDKYVVTADIVHGVFLHKWRDYDMLLSCLAQEYPPSNVLTADFIADGAELAIAATDDRGGITMLQYRPDRSDARPIQRLDACGDLNAGSPLLCSVRTRLFLPPGAPASAGRIGLFFGGADGSVSLLSPVDERGYSRLSALYDILVNALEHTAGGNPRAFHERRMGIWHSRRHLGRGIADADLPRRFLSLPRDLQRQVSQAVGTTTDQLIDTLLLLDQCTTVW